MAQYATELSVGVNDVQKQVPYGTGTHKASVNLRSSLSTMKAEWVSSGKNSHDNKTDCKNKSYKGIENGSKEATTAINIAPNLVCIM